MFRTLLMLTMAVALTGCLNELYKIPIGTPGPCFGCVGIVGGHTGYYPANSGSGDGGHYHPH